MPLDVSGWIAAYGRARREKDPNAVAALFTDQAVYRSSPLREPNVGRASIREYWSSAVADQERLTMQLSSQSWTATTRRWSGGQLWRIEPGRKLKLRPTHDSPCPAVECFALTTAGAARRCGNTGTSLSVRRCRRSMVGVNSDTSQSGP